MLAVPPALLDILNLQAGATVGIAVERGVSLSSHSGGAAIA